jgi:hypothetical protein
MNRKIVVFGLFVLLLLISACSLPAGNTSQVVTETVNTAAIAMTATETIQLPTLTTAPTQTTEATLTMAATSTTTPCNWAEFVSDINYPDNTVVPAGTQFTKTWQIKNAGTCNWTSAYTVIFFSGDQMGASASTQLVNGAVAPGGIVNVSVTLTAPQEAGTFIAYFKLADANNTPFGVGANASNAFWVQIVSEAAGSSGGQTQSSTVGFTRTLSVTSPYMEGDDVEQVQNRLAELGYDPGTVDGVYGSKTANAVKAFQDDKGLKPDGIVGQQTWNVLFN